MASAAVAVQLEDEKLIRDKTAELQMPPGVAFTRFDLSEDWTGDPVWRIYFTVSKKIPLTRKRVRELVDMEYRLRQTLRDGNLEYPAMVTLLDGR